MKDLSERIELENAQGHRLVGRLHSPPGSVRAYALFAHCFTCSKDLQAAIRIGSQLATRGIATLRFDFTGLGESEGDFEGTHFSSNVEDIIAVADFLRERFSAPQVLIGHSLGGAAVLAAADRIPESKAVVTIGAPAEPDHVVGIFEPAVKTIEEEGQAEVSIAGRRFTIRKTLLDDLRGHQNRKSIAKLGRALMIFHSPEDEIVGIDNARMIYEAARHPKSFVSLDRADHLLTRREDADYVAEVLSAWAGRYVEEHEGLEEEIPRGEVRVSGGKSGFLQAVETESHRLLADEPERVGGTDLGPSPYDYLLAALGSCTAMTLQMYARRKKWSLDAVRVTLSHERVHAEDCEDCEDESRRVDRLRRVIGMDGDLDEEQELRLMEIADRCPVHRTLMGTIRIDTGKE